ncbi:hypothetical protein KEM52_002330 [Ascosphaera acerosa]|nr:hypothetical protein KEM52_002330 [Ascosphaera acerosa]
MSSTIALQLPSAGEIKSYFQSWPSNTSNALKTTFTSLTVRDYIRLVWIVGGYVFLRPHLERGFKFLFDRGQKKQAAAEEEEEEEEEDDAQFHTRMSANDLRGTASGAQAGGDGDEDEEDEGLRKRPVPQWGRAARLRQKKAIQLIEEEFARRKEEEDDADIADLLED